MSYAYVKATTLSPLYLDDFYGRHPGLEEKSYAEQYQELMGDGHVWADHFSRHLRARGVDAHEIVYNAAPLQAAWAREHGLDGEGKTLFVEQLRAIKPDVLFLHVSYPMYEELVPLIRERVPSVRLIQGWVCVGFGPEHHHLFRSVDFVTTCERGIHSALCEAGARAYHIPHGFEHTLAQGLPERTPETDFFFAGNMVMSGGYHLRRAAILDQLQKEDIDMRLHSRVVEVSQEVPDSLRKTILPPIFGHDMLRAINAARIAFNIHIDMTSSAANLRLFEATGAGACLLTDAQPGLDELFQIDTEVVTYASVEECVEKVRWLLDNPEEREAIARAGQQRTLQDHRLEDRVGRMHDIIQQELHRVSGRGA